MTVAEPAARPNRPWTAGPDAGAEIVRRQLTETEPLDEVAACDHLVLRSDRPVAAISD